MGSKLRSLRKQLAGGVIKLADKLLDHLENVEVAPPVPILVGAVAVCAGAAFIKHLQRGKNKNSPKAPTTQEVCRLCALWYLPYLSFGPNLLCWSHMLIQQVLQEDENFTESVPSPVSSPSSTISSPRSPAPTSPVSFHPQILPFSIRGPTAIPRQTPSNSQMTVFSLASPARASLSTIPEQTDLTFPTPEKGADDMALDYDHLDESEERAALQSHHRASDVLSNLTNRIQDSSSPASPPHTGAVPPLNLDQLADRAMQTREASAELSRLHKSEHLAIEDTENNAF